ncbi:MAG: MotA/TolQ/ExbB proton channel family protein [Planctomycetota bacterium]|nr:MotA/TolQ/ExbB proton channel family protein [Planctomycetota bacterium]
MKITQISSRMAQMARPAVFAVAALTASATIALAQEGDAAAAAASAEEGISIGGLIKDSGPIGWCIILLSIVALALIIEAFTSLKRDKLAPPDQIDEIQALFDEGQYQEAMNLCEEEPNYFTRVCAAGISKIGHDFEVIEKSLEEMGDEESIKLHQKIGWLSLISNIAPMMGLVAAFKKIASSGGQASPAELAAGISVALLTTMFGLIVAIPTTAVFAFLRNRMIRTIIETGAIVEDLFERFRPGEQE